MASEMTATSAADSDGSVSWEDFFGTSTDLVPQLLGMFDELARKDGVNNRSGDQIPTALQKRLSLVAAHSQRNTIFGQIRSTAYTDKSTVPAMKENTSSDKITRVEITVCHDNTINDKIKNPEIDENEKKIESSSSRLMPENSLRGRNKKHLDRPLSGSSIASSTSSSGGSNQDNVASANPYLASVESLADACASSQGSGDSGVGTGSFKEANCMTKRDNMNQRKKMLSENAISRNTVERVLLEIVDTEAIYVEHLRQVINGYLIFWRDDPNSLLRKYELSNLFNNIEDIFNFNRKFLNEIKDCQLEPIRVANKFIKHNLGFKIYTEYCTNYPSAVSTLTELMRRDDSAKGFRERQEALGHALPLGSFLLKPVQRILKYHLLLENLSKEFGADETRKNYNDGKNVIDEALKTMTGIAEHINAMKRKHEHAVRVQEIQSLLYGWTGDDLTTNGELIAEGRFRIRGAKAPRHAFLFERMLLLTKKKEDGLLVYKAHIMCSNLMLIESIPGEPFSFHVIPFDNPRLQYTLQARNLEQKREWTLQIKRVMLENYHAVIPIHARQLVLELGQSHHDDEQSSEKISMKKLYTSPPEYLERRKLEKDRRRLEAGLRHKLKKPSMKSDLNENSFFSINSVSSSSTTSSLSSSSTQREQNLNRSLDNRASKVKDRLTNWRRKSEPGFQSYVSFTQSEDDGNDKDDKIKEQKMEKPIDNSNDPIIDACRQDTCINNSTSKHVNLQPQTVEQIVGHILMQNEEFQKLLEKQRNNNTTNIRQQQRFSKDPKKIQIDTSDESDGVDHSPIKPLGNRITRLNRITGINRSQLREYRSLGTNSWNPRISRLQPDSNHLVLPHLRLEYNNFKSDDQSILKSHDKIFKRPSIITDSKIIKTALRMASDEFQDDNNKKRIDCPTRPSVWLTKLCEDLPTWQQKSGSLPRSFQINSETTGDFTEENQVISQSRFLQRDGKPLSGRPFTIASDKPAEINLDDLERYKYKSDEQIDELSTSELNSASTFFCSTGDNSPADSDNDKIHPDHKIYRSHVGSTMLKNVLSKAGSRLEGLRLTWSTETLESSDSLISDKIKCQYNYNHKGKKRNKIKLSRLLRESSTHVDEPVHGCIPSTWSRDNNSSTILYYEQGSSGLGARIAQADYADPSILFGNYFNTKRTDNLMNSDKLDNEEESDCFYEKSFETIEDCDSCVHTDEGHVDDALRDSAIFSDNEEGIIDQLTTQVSNGNSVKSKIPPPVPIKKQSPYAKTTKLSLHTKPENSKLHEITQENQDNSLKFLNFSVINNERDHIVNNDVSSGQSQAGWVKRMVGQLQAQIETT